MIIIRLLILSISLVLVKPTDVLEECQGLRCVRILLLKDNSYEGQYAENPKQCIKVLTYKERMNKIFSQYLLDELDILISIRVRGQAKDLGIDFCIDILREIMEYMDYSYPC